MTVETVSTISGPYPADGITRSWQFDFRAADPASLRVLVIGENGERLFYAPSSVQLAPNGIGGSVVYPSAPADALAAPAAVYVVRETQPIQKSRFANAAFYPRKHEDVFDRLMMIAQELMDGLKRSVRVSHGQTINPFDLEAARGKFLGVTQDGVVKGLDGIDLTAALDAAVLAVIDEVKDEIRDDVVSSVLAQVGRSRKQLEQQEIGADVQALQTSGFWVAGDGGAGTYTRLGMTRPTSRGPVCRVNNPTFYKDGALWTVGAGWKADGDGVAVRQTGIAIRRNEAQYGRSNSDEMFISGVDADGIQRDVDGSITIGGTPTVVPKGYILRQDNQAGSWWLVFNRAGSWAVVNATQGNPRVAACRKVGLTWQYDNNGGWVDFVPTADHFVIGAVTANSTTITEVSVSAVPLPIGTVGEVVAHFTHGALAPNDYVMTGVVAGQEMRVDWRIGDRQNGSAHVDVIDTSNGAVIFAGPNRSAVGAYSESCTLSGTGPWAIRVNGDTSFIGRISDVRPYEMLTEPGAFQTADGAWWRLVTSEADIRQFGLRASSTPQEVTIAGQSAHDYAGLFCGKTRWPAGDWTIVNEMKCWSRTVTDGAGREATRLRLNDDDVGGSRCVFTNCGNVRNSFSVGLWDEEIRINNITADANVRRFMLNAATFAFTAALTLAPHASFSMTLPVPGMTTDGRCQAYVDTYDGKEIDGLSCRTTRLVDEVLCKVINTTELPLVIPADAVLVTGRYTYSTGGSSSGCAFGFANCRSVYLDSVRGCNAPKHALDYSASSFGIDNGFSAEGYPYGAGRFLWVSNSVFTQGGDDNVTTHGAEWMWFENCNSYNCGQTYIYSNSNGYEIDDSSRYCWIVNCRACNVQSGIEIKGHDENPSANHLWVSNLSVIYSLGAAFDCHHRQGSPTGRQIHINGLFTKNCFAACRLYHFADVKIDGVSVEDTGGWYGTDPIINIQNGANLVTVENVTIGSKTSVRAVYVQESVTADVFLSNIIGYGGTSYGVYLASAVKRVSLRDIVLRHPDPDNNAGSRGLGTYNAPSTYDFDASGCAFYDYEKPVRTSNGGAAVDWDNQIDFVNGREMVFSHPSDVNNAWMIRALTNGAARGGIGVRNNRVEFRATSNPDFIITMCSGSPEGVVEAGPKSICFSDNGTRYKKGDGPVSKTGWAADV